MKWVFQFGCHSTPSLIITLKRMVKLLTVQFPILRTTYTHVDHYSKLQFDVAMFALLSCHPSYENFIILLIVYRPSRLICTA